MLTVVRAHVSHHLCVCVVQVVSEASDAAAKGILHHCHATRLVAQVCDILTADKSAKLRKHCSAYLLEVRCRSHRLCRWPPGWRVYCTQEHTAGGATAVG